MGCHFSEFAGWVLATSDNLALSVLGKGVGDPVERARGITFHEKDRKARASPLRNRPNASGGGSSAADRADPASCVRAAESVGNAGWAEAGKKAKVAVVTDDRLALGVIYE